MTLFPAELKEVFDSVWLIFSFIWFLVLPPLLFYLFKFLWLDYIQGLFAKSIEWTLLEIIPPRDIEKSPKLMESFFSGFSGTSKGYITSEEFIKGMFPDSISIEMVSDGGIVHFYIRTPKHFRNLVEANLYAQYPDAEIIEVPDYVNDVPRVVPNSEWDLWGSDLELVKPDVYPIKTYDRFEEDITGKMIDPLSSILEAMGKIAPDQKIWIQMVVYPEPEGWSKKGRAHIEESIGRKSKPKSIFAEIWADLGDIFGNILNGIFSTVEFAGKSETKEEAPLEFRLTPGEKEVLKAMEDQVGKNIFNVKMRFLYLGKRENFTKTHVSSIMGAIKQFNDMNLNAFKPNDVSKTAATYLLVDSRLRYRQRKIFQRYLKRDTKGAKFRLTTSELATIFHMPDMSVVAPSTPRVEAKRGGAPTNLPV